MQELSVTYLYLYLYIQGMELSMVAKTTQSLYGNTEHAR